MSTAVMNSAMFECGELFKNVSSSKQQQQQQQLQQQHQQEQQLQQKEAHAMLREAAAVAAAAAASGNGHAPLRRSYTSLVNLIEQHRKLDRTVSEPTSRYKTELCRPFEENGSCKYGDKCQFAHGPSELRNLARHPKYKTELCRTFHKIGFCPYGPRCHFVHNFEEARIHNLKVSAQLGHHQQQQQGPGALGPLLGINMNLLEQLAAAPQLVAAVAAASSGPLGRANSLNLGLNPHTHAPLHRSSSLGVRPKPLNLSPTLSLGSSTDSISPTSSLSQSPTNSMASFFSDDLASGRLVGSAAVFGFAQELTMLGAGARQSPSPQAELASPRTPSPLSPGAESRLPVFNRISNTIADLEHLKI